MKKILSIIAVSAVALFAAVNASAIDHQDSNGTVKIGVRSGFYPGIGANASADVVIFDNWWKGHFTVGGYLGYDSILKTSYAAYAFLPRATYGLNITRHFEVHVGAMTGLLWNVNAKTPGWSYGALVGCDYFFNNFFGLTAELCYGESTNSYSLPYANAGLVFKF